MKQTKLITKLVTASVIVLGLITGVVYSHHPTAGNYLIAAIVLLSVVDIELYYRHEIHTRSWEFDGLFLLPSGTWILFFIVAASYLLSGGDRKIPLFTNGGLPVNQPDDVARISLGSGMSISVPGLHEGEHIPVAPGFSCALQKGTLYCDFNVLGRRLSPLISVRHNQLDKPLPPGWMSNNNDVALEIVDQDEDPVFQMYYEGTKEIAINGIFAGHGGVFIAGPKDFTIVTYNSPKLAAFLQTFKLRRLFKYPGAVFPGVPN